MSFFNKENLQSIGLNDEQIEKIFAERGKELIKQKNLEESNQQYKGQLEELTKKLEEVKKLEAEKAQKEIESINDANKQKIEEIEKNNKELVKKMAIKMNLSDAHDPDILINLLDLSKIKTDENGNIKSGLDEQLESVRKEKSFLFKSDNKAKLKGTTPAEGSVKNEAKTNYAELLSEARKNGDNERAIQIINEASANGQYIR